MPPAAEKQKDGDTTLPVLTHVLGLIAAPLSTLIILLATKDEYAKKHARRALNWQLSFIIYYIISLILILVLIGIVFVVILIVLHIVFSIIAAVKASKGMLWTYPLAIPFLRD